MLYICRSIFFSLFDNNIKSYVQKRKQVLPENMKKNVFFGSNGPITVVED